MLLLVGLLLGYAFWWSKPKLFPEDGNAFTPTPGQAASYTATIVFPGEGDSEGEVLTLLAIEPGLVQDTTRAQITFDLCQIQGSPSLVSNGGAERSCVNPVQLRSGMKIKLTDHTTLTMTVKPRREGTVVIHGATITYRRDAKHLWQTGSQQIGLHMKVLNPRG